MNKLYIFIGISIIVVVGGLFLFIRGTTSSKNNQNPLPTPSTNLIETIPENSLDIKLQPREDKKAVIIIASGLLEKGFSQFEYELSYDTEDGLTQGSFSKEPIKVTGDEFKREILLGTCSKNVCKYDKGVKSVKLTFRLTDKEGKIKIWEKEFPM